MISNFLSSFTTFSVIVIVFLTKLLTLGTLFSTVVRVAVVAKLEMLCISPLISFILAIREALVAQ